MSEPLPGDESDLNKLYSASKHTIQGAGENVHEAKEAVNKATASIKDLLSGKGNMVDTALAVKGAYDNVMGLTGRLSATAMMPVMKALAAFKGQAFLPAGKQMDPVLGIDVHMVTIPPSPLPVPLPHPYIGMLFNAKDWVSCLINTYKKAGLDTLPPPAEGDKGIVASVVKNKEAIAGIAMGLAGMSASVKFGGTIPRAITGTKTKNITHIPFGAGWFAANDAAVAKNIGKAFLGSLFVVADGDPLVGSFHLNYDCWDVGVIDVFKGRRASAKKAPEPGKAKAELFVPSGTILPIPLGRPVLVNSIPTPINPLTALDKLFKAGLAKLKKHAVEAAINIAKNTEAGKKAGCDFWTAVSAEHGTGQSHPVDVSGGYFYTNADDFNLPGPIPFVWQRIWQSFSDYKGPLGYGWHHSYDIALSFDKAANIAVIRMADGRPSAFEIPTFGNPSYNRGEKLSLNFHADGYYYATDINNFIYRFSEKEYKNPYSGTETHLLQSIANLNGFAIRLSYDRNGLLTKIIDSAARILTINSDSQGRITRICAPHPEKAGETFVIAGYEYTQAGDMEKQTNALDQSMHFAYADHLMVKEVWRNAFTWNFRYNATSGKNAKCIEVWGDGNLLHYKFDYTDPQCTIVITSLGYKKTFFHKNGLVTKYIDPNGGSREYRYNKYSEKEWEIDAIGNQKIITYDRWGNVSTIIEPNGSYTSIEYNLPEFRHLPTDAADSSGGKWKWEYDRAGNQLKKTDPLHAATGYQYSNGLLTCIVDSIGQKTYLQYDSMYNLVKVIATNDYFVQKDYDVLGRCIRSTNLTNNITRVQYNLIGQPETIIEPDGNIRHFQYDADGNIVNCKDKHVDTAFVYNALSNLVIKRQAGRNLKYIYNTEGQLTEVINQESKSYKFELDANGKVIKETSFDGIVRKFIRDMAGRVTEVIRPGGNVVKLEYDEMGKIIEVNYHDGSYEKYVYRPDGQLIQIKNHNTSISFERDVFGRIIKEACDDITIEHQFDIFGNKIHSASSLGADIINTYDNIGNLVGIKMNNWENILSYNELGLAVQRLLPGNVTCEWVRDKVGRVITQSITSKYNILNSRRYSWDVNFRLLKIMDSKTGVTFFEHDEISNLKRTVFGDKTEQLRNRDVVGNLFTTTDRSDRIYGPGGKLLKSQGNNYKYDDEGNLIEKKEHNGLVWKYEWTASGMLRSVKRPDGELVSFTYDAIGRRISKQYKNTITRWIWNGVTPLHEWKEHAITGDILSNSTVGADGIITWVFEEHSFFPVAKIKGSKYYSIISDHIGTPFEMYQEDGKRFWAAQLDSYGKVRMQEGDEGSCPFRYQGQYEDVETGLYYNRFRYYAPTEGVYINPDPIGFVSGEPNFYAYTKDPNIWVDVFGLQPSRPGGYQSGDVDSHGQLSPGDNRAPGSTNTAADDRVQSHHPVQNAWAQRNVPGYDPNAAPAVLLPSSSGQPHAIISGLQRADRNANGWGGNLPDEIRKGYDQMLQAGVPESVARKAISDSYKYFSSIGAV